MLDLSFPRLVCLTGLLFASGCPQGEGGGDDSGGLTYVKSYGAVGAEARIAHTTVTRDGGTAMVGYVEKAQQADGTFSRGLVVTRTDGAGDVVWSRTYGAFEAQDFALREFGPAVPSPDGGVVIAGQSDQGPSLVQLDANGRFVWQRHYPQVHRVHIQSLIHTTAGNYVMAGDIETGPDRFDAFLLSTTGDGTQGDVRTDFDDDGTTSETVFSIRERAGGYVVTGIRDGDDWIAELDTAFRPSGIDRTDGTGSFGAAPGTNVRYVTAGITGITQDGGVVSAENPFGVVTGLDDEGFQKWFAVLDDPPRPEDPSPPTALFAVSRDDGRDLVVAAGGTLDVRGRALTGHLIGVREPVEPVLYPPALRHVPEFDVDFGILGARTIAWDVAVTPDGDYVVAGGFSNPPDDPAGSFSLEPWVARIDGTTHFFEWRVRLWKQAPGCDDRVDPQPFRGMVGTTVHALGDGTILFSSKKCVAKLSANGDVLWGASSAPAQEDGRRIRETADGGFVVVGSKRAQGGELPLPFILRLDSEGRIVWQRLIASETGGIATDVAEHGDGFLVTGTEDSTAQTWLARLDGDGRLGFARHYAAFSALPGPRIVVRDGVVIALLGSGVIARLDGDNGNVVWSRRAFATDLRLRDIDVFSDGSIAVTGGVPFGHPGSSSFMFIPPVPFVARLDPDGGLLWSNVYATTQAVSINGEGMAVRVTSDGGLAVAATASFRNDPLGRCNALAVFYDETQQACTDMLLFKLGGDGNVLFGRIYGTATSELAASLASTPDNGFLMVGASDGFGFPRYSGFVVRADANGRVAEGCPAGLDEETHVAKFAVGLTVDPFAVDHGDIELTTVGPEVFAVDNATEVARACFGESQAQILTVTVTGGGSVTSQPEGISCGEDCEQAYPNGTTITLTAGAADGQTFLGWGGDCADQATRNPIEITLSRSLSCTAAFGQPGEGFDLVLTDDSVSLGGSAQQAETTVNLARGGYAGDVVLSIEGCPLGVVCTLDRNTIPAGESSARITFRFNDGAPGSTTVTVRGTGGEHTASDTIIVSVLGPGENPTLTLTVAGPSGRGVVTLMPAQTACQTGEQCAYMYPVNTVVTLQATPYEGFSFGGWTGCDIAEGPFCSVTMNGNRAVTAQIN